MWNNCLQDVMLWLNNRLLEDKAKDKDIHRWNGLNLTFIALIPNKFIQNSTIINQQL